MYKCVSQQFVYCSCAIGTKDTRQSFSWSNPQTTPLGLNVGGLYQWLTNQFVELKVYGTRQLPI